MWHVDDVVLVCIYMPSDARQTCDVTAEASNLASEPGSTIRILWICISLQLKLCNLTELL